VDHWDLREQNRLSWNAVVGAHQSHRGDLAEFLSGGGNTLFPEERALLGDLRGKTLAHLQCNSGGDSLSLALLGATVTGVDISDEAIDFARQLSADSGIPATFERSDVYPWLEHAAAEDKSFDVVFCSYGALCWLSNIDEWFKRVAAVLKPGGRFVCVEFHPVAMIFDEQGVPTYGYSIAEPLFWDDGIRDYVADACGGLTPSGPSIAAEPFRNPHPAYEFQRGLSEILGAALRAGLAVREFREYLYSNGWKPFTDMKALPGRRWTMPEGKPSIPLMFGLAARRV
jgi:SAM-dependent methyltransferase